MSSLLLKPKLSLLFISCISLSISGLTTQAHAGLFDNYTDTAQNFRSSLTQPISAPTQELFEKKLKVMMQRCIY
jgi:hypothetical protein